MKYKATPDMNGVVLEISDADTHTEHLIPDPDEAVELGVKLIRAGESTERMETPPTE